MTNLFAIGMPGPMEMLIILAIVLLLFGGARLPSLMRNLGRSAKEFQKGVHGVDEEDDDYAKSSSDKDT